MVAAEHDWGQAGLEHLPDVASIACVRSGRIRGEDRRVPEVDHFQFREHVHLGLEVLAGGTTRGPMARGPSGFPVGPDTRSSVGAPTIATSMPASTPGSTSTERR